MNGNVKIDVIPKRPLSTSYTLLWICSYIQGGCRKSGCPSKTMGFHHSDVIMSALAFQITSVSIVCSTVCSCTDQRKHQSSASLAFEWNSPVTGGFPSQRSSNAENNSIWWRHHVLCLLPIVFKMLPCFLRNRKNNWAPRIWQRKWILLANRILPDLSLRWIS